MVGRYLAGNVSLGSHNSLFNQSHSLHDSGIGLFFLSQDNAGHFLNFLAFLLDFVVEVSSFLVLLNFILQVLESMDLFLQLCVFPPQLFYFCFIHFHIHALQFLLTKLIKSVMNQLSAFIYG